jgi:hypothetical protein
MTTPLYPPDDPRYGVVSWPLFTVWRKVGPLWTAQGGCDSYREALQLRAERGADLVLPRGQRP